jgi:hypothetical protein
MIKDLAVQHLRDEILDFSLEVLAWDKLYGLRFWNADRLFSFRINAFSGFSFRYFKSSKSDQLHQLILFHADLNGIDNRCDRPFCLRLTRLASELLQDRFN